MILPLYGWCWHTSLSFHEGWGMPSNLYHPIASLLSLHTPLKTFHIGQGILMPLSLLELGEWLISSYLDLVHLGGGWTWPSLYWVLRIYSWHCFDEWRWRFVKTKVDYRCIKFVLTKLRGDGHIASKAPIVIQCHDLPWA